MASFLEGLPKAPPRPQKKLENGGAISVGKTVPSEGLEAFGGLIPVPENDTEETVSAEKSGIMSVEAAQPSDPYGGLEPVRPGDDVLSVEASEAELTQEEMEALGMSSSAREADPKISEAERKRREKVTKTLRWASHADESFLLFTANTLVSESERATVARERLQAIETMDTGREVERKALGGSEGGSVNIVTKRVYEDSSGNRALGYAKSSLGDPTFFVNEKGLMRRVRTAKEDGDPGIEEDVYLDVNDPYEGPVVEMYRQKTANFPTIQAEIAAAYGISPSEVPLDPNDFGPREGIPTGDSAVREWAASRIDSILGTNVVPPVVLKAESGGSDIVSVQQEAKSERGPLATLTKSEFDAIVRDGPKHPMARDIMRMAVLDDLIKTVDRHPRNILSGRAIDNGLSMGLSKKGTDGNIVPADGQYRSVAMEMVQRYRDGGGAEPWEIDKETLESLGAALDEWKAAKAGGAVGQTVKTLSLVFRVAYGENTKISHVELRQFFEKLDQTVAQKGMRQVKIGFGSGELLPLSQNEELFG
jgi:hypothetical protein